jgi:phosphotransferase system enzyme I (PtsI)
MEFLEEIPELLAAGAEGIGLYRTEFLFLDRLEAPTEEEHYLAYRSVLRRWATAGHHPDRRSRGRQDARLSQGGAEPNPAMGLRAIRHR